MAEDYSETSENEYHQIIKYFKKKREKYNISINSPSYRLMKDQYAILGMSAGTICSFLFFIGILKLMSTTKLDVVWLPICVFSVLGIVISRKIVESSL